MVLKRSLTFLLCLVIAVSSLFASCGNVPEKSTGAETDSSAETETETETEADTLFAVKTVEPDNSVSLSRLSENTRPALISAIHPTEDVIIADIVATDEKYGADPTGQKDSSDAIINALNDCYAAGGGTVWLPAGQYTVSKSINIPSFVTLRGEIPLDDPKSIEDYGTVIHATKKATRSAISSVLFAIGGSGGVRGLTVWYPDQSLKNVIEYEYTFYVNGTNVPGAYMCQTVKDVLIVNGYKGIGACVFETNAHEQMTVENVRGTFLCQGADCRNSADVGIWRNIRISPEYWANSPFEGSPTLEEIRKYTRENTVGLTLGDLEWDEFSKIEIEDCSIGIQTVKGVRAYFTGEMFDVTVRRCGIGLSTNVMDQRWGMNLAKANFEDCDQIILNKSRAAIKLTDVKIPETAELNKYSLSADGDLSGYSFDYDRTYKKPAENVYTAVLDNEGKTDVSALIQGALNEIGKEGGVLYLPAGEYRMDNPVFVPNGVEFRGCSSLSQRDQGGLSIGTLIITDHGRDTDNDGTALINLGVNSGVNGMRFIYPQNGPLSAKSTPYVIRGCGSGVYCVNTCITAADCGIDFKDCDRHFIKCLTICCYSNSIRVGGKSGQISQCLQNGTVITRIGLADVNGWISESDIFTKLFPKLRKKSLYINISGASDEQLMCCFAYGAKTVLSVNDSENVLAINLGGDNVGDNKPLVNVTKSTVTIINSQRYNGVGLKYDSDSDICYFNPLTIGDKNEPNLIHNEKHEFIKSGK